MGLQNPFAQWLPRCLLVVAGLGLGSAHATSVWPSLSDLGRALKGADTTWVNVLPPTLPVRVAANVVTMPLPIFSAPANLAAHELQGHHSSPRDLLVKLADAQIDIRYRRGGREPSTGFDCSGFVRYVFEHSLGLLLPRSSAAQYRTGEKVARRDLRRGDLVFFHIRGKRISHVGIYVADGRFIHAPSTGKRVRIDRLDEAYWARHFAGARRVEMLAQQDAASGTQTPRAP